MLVLELHQPGEKTWDIHIIGIINRYPKSNGVESAKTPGTSSAPVQYEYDVPDDPQVDDELIRFNGVGDNGHEYSLRWRA
ncbi:MAG: hypothetical protein KAS32_24780 [Candidatus Peribacteraceae bacterium]|nr:hypothetical protein [Candidatus Peribacteraceae bacterium]